MTPAAVVFGSILALFVLMAYLCTLGTIERIRVAKHRPCGCDPRSDEDLRQEAQRKVQGS